MGEATLESVFLGMVDGAEGSDPTPARGGTPRPHASAGPRRGPDVRIPPVLRLVVRNFASNLDPRTVIVRFGQPAVTIVVRGTMFGSIRSSSVTGGAPTRPSSSPAGSPSR